jgi:hypothetical protein
MSESQMDFTKFVASLPAKAETELITSPHAPTALAMARRAGWSLETLIADAQAAWRRTEGVGVIITRLRALSNTRPINSRVTAQSAMPPRWVTETPDRLPHEWVVERIRLLWKIRDEKLPDGDQVMRDLIARQRRDDRADEPTWAGDW